MGRTGLITITAAATLAAAVLAGGAGPASAITNGQADEARHPYVGALVSHDGRDRKHRLICSGTLLSPTVFLTAAHCLKGEPASLYVSFDAFVGAPSVDRSVVTLHPGTAVAHPQFTDETLPGDTHDVAVVKLDPPVEGIAPGTLPFEQTLTAEPGQSYKLVGYGQEGRLNNQPVGGGGRRFAFGAFSALENFKLRLDQTGTTGGTCNGDSGGPVMLGDSATVVGVTSDVDADCVSHGVYYRTDTASARDFLDEHVAVPTRPPAPGGTPGGTPGGSPPPGQVKPRPVAGRVLRRFAVSRRGALVLRLTVDQLPPGATARVRCVAPSRAPRACPFTTRRVTGRTLVGFTRAFRGRRLRRGTVVAVQLSAPGALSRTIRFTVLSTRVRVTGA